jgi:TolA-binding protein
MADEVETAMSTIADGLEQPSWADVMTQAENLTKKGKIPPPKDIGRAPPKHDISESKSKKPAWKTKRNSKVSQSSNLETDKGKEQVAPPADRPYLRKPKGATISEKLSKGLDALPPQVPELPGEIEDDVDRLSHVTSEHEMKIEAMEETLSAAQRRIQELEEDQKVIMSDFSALRHEVNLLRAQLHVGIQTPAKGTPSSISSVSVSKGRETVRAPPSSSKDNIPKSVDSVPAWKKKKL